MFLKHVLPAVLRPIRTLWNEIIGFLFICFAVVFGFKTASYVKEYLQAGGSPGDELARLAMAGVFTLVMAWYGFSSFRRARKISRS
jgi:hypothetical protein